MESFLSKAKEQFPVLLVTGARQVGKTSLLKHLASSDYQYVSLDNVTLANLARSEPQLFMQKYAPPVIIDEIQYAPQLLPFIKIYADNTEKKGQIWLTGSQQFHMMKNVAESLAGRVGIINLLGLSLYEERQIGQLQKPFLPSNFQIAREDKQILNLEDKLDQDNNLKFIQILDLYHKIWRGSYPAIALNEEIDWDFFYSSYVATYLQRDIRDLANIENIGNFNKFLRLTAARTGQVLNIADLARDAEISPNTAKNWLAILTASNIIYLLEPYHNNMSKRLVKAPKIYFFDTGLCSYLTDWTSAKSLESGAMSGAMFETYAIGQIIKSYWHNGKKPKIYYYRDKDKKEIDLLFVQDQTIYPCEIKKTANADKNHVKNFSLLEKFNLKIGQGALICLTEEILPIKENISAIPIWMV